MRAFRKIIAAFVIATIALVMSCTVALPYSGWTYYYESCSCSGSPPDQAMSKSGTSKFEAELVSCWCDFDLFEIWFDYEGMAETHKKPNYVWTTVSGSTEDLNPDYEAGVRNFPALSGAHIEKSTWIAPYDPNQIYQIPLRIEVWGLVYANYKGAPGFARSSITITPTTWHPALGQEIPITGNTHIAESCDPDWECSGKVSLGWPFYHKYKANVAIGGEHGPAFRVDLRVAGAARIDLWAVDSSWSPHGEGKGKAVAFADPLIYVDPNYEHIDEIEIIHSPLDDPTVFGPLPKGDLDRDGIVGAGDAISGLRALSGLPTLPATIPEELTIELQGLDVEFSWFDYERGDLNEDGQFGLADVLYSLQMIAGLR